MIRGIRLRLALGLLVVVGGALGVAYLIIVPTLESRLVGAKLEQLAKDARTVGSCLETEAFSWQECADRGATLLHARTVVYLVLPAGAQPLLQIVGDSQLTTSSTDVARDPVAIRAAVSGRPQTGTVERKGERFGEAALPTPGGPIVLMTSSLEDSLSSVAVVERRLAIAAVIALVVALLVGYGGASLHARRIRRLERGAERIAAGRFDEPVLDRGNDELGELADAFDRMRVRLENLDRARREFIANASHELRTPLFSLGGFLELLTDEELDEATRAEFLTTMREQVERLTKLATDLLDLTRLDAGRLHVDDAGVDLVDVAHVLCEEFRVVAERGRHRLRIDDDGAPLARADEQRVLQAARALVDNALVHTPAGTEVVLRVAREDGQAVLAVCDDGTGIPAAALPHVFDRFYRADGDRASGSGLGLAIARELATLMGGRVRLESRPGRTVVSLVLPLEEREAAEPERTPVFT
ncbi:MAG TPA: ATP-binding protein [Gaiellaceae bacterium]|nr:ATP-binding protein [Gaiellaceae bacterium]